MLEQRRNRLRKRRGSWTVKEMIRVRVEDVDMREDQRKTEEEKKRREVKIR